MSGQAVVSNKIYINEDFGDFGLILTLRLMFRKKSPSSTFARFGVYFKASKEVEAGK